MAKVQKQALAERDVVQADIIHLPFRDGQFDILHTRFVIMNLPESQRADAIRELSRCGKKNIIMDYNWEKFHSENPLVKSFIANAKKLGELAGSDLNFGGKLKEFIETTLPGAAVTKKSFNQGPIKNYATLESLAKSMQGLAKNLQSTEIQVAEQEKRLVNQSLIDSLNSLILELQNSESEFGKIVAMKDQSAVVPFTSPDIVAVTF